VSLLQRGSRGSAVGRWQAFLSARGFLRDAQDGIFGEQTARATARFQGSRRIQPDGVVGPATLRAASALGFNEEPIAAPPRPAPPQIEPAQPANDFFPPKPSFPPLVGDQGRRAVFGAFTFVPAPTAGNPEAIRLTDNWAATNIVSVDVPGLAGIPVGGTTRVSRGKMSFHRKAADQLVRLWRAWGDAGLLNRILTFDGAYNPRFQRRSTTRLSNHAFGSAFDINARQNPFQRPVAARGKEGCVLDLVALANEHGFFWGGHFSPNTDGMHFEIAKLF